MITPERFATGMTFDEYVRYVGTPENLAREAGSWLGPQRRDFSGLLRAWYARVQLSGAQMDAIRWLASQPDGPARVLVISEEWSSDQAKRESRHGRASCVTGARSSSRPSS